MHGRSQWPTEQQTDRRGGAYVAVSQRAKTEPLGRLSFCRSPSDA